MANYETDKDNRQNGIETSGSLVGLLEQQQHSSSLQNQEKKYERN
jgi:hypothetical protein